MTPPSGANPDRFVLSASADDDSAELSALSISATGMRERMIKHAIYKRMIEKRLNNNERKKIACNVTRAVKEFYVFCTTSSINNG